MTHKKSKLADAPLLIIFAMLTSVSSANFSENLHANHMIVNGPQASHTRDANGNFKHPFLNQPNHV